ncbi:MAG: DUF4118 domain-containing protein [Acidobacteriota bacterium]|nr:DUF4118 domain-containing protein [Acidobacteriota bacterium]
MMPAYLALLAAALFAFCLSVAIHRYVALCTLAGGGVSVAYFFMEPIYSFQVSEIPDLVALGAYSVFGVLLTFASHKKHPITRPGSGDFGNDPAHRSVEDNREFCLRAGLEQALEMYSPRLRQLGLAIEASGLPEIPVAAQDEVVKIFSDLISTTLETPGAQHVAVNFGLTPETLRLYWIVRTRPMPPRYLMRIGSADDVSEPTNFPQWPAAIETTALRNPFQVIHQISFRRCRNRTQSVKSSAIAAPISTHKTEG